MFANVCFEILTNKVPFENDDIFSAAIEIRDNGRHPLLPEGSDPRLVEILDKCWSKDPNDRPSMDSVIEQFEQKFDFIGESESD
jgi:serine/threonine protein kinase